ncbi:MAG: ribonuclease E/G, partial [Pseudomonadota bacterium]
AARKLHRSLQRGARVTFDEAEALTSVDVDAGEAAARASALTINEGAAKEIAQALRMREVAGQVLIDFAGLGRGKERSSVRRAFERAAAGDPAAVQVFGFTKLGLMELTRQRTRVSLLSAWSEPDEGRLFPGRRLKAGRIARLAIHGLERALAEHVADRIRLDLSSQAAAYIEQRPRWSSRLKARFGARFEIRASAAQARETFDVRPV